MLGNTSLKRKIGKTDLLTYLKKVKEPKTGEGKKKSAQKKKRAV